MNNPGNLLARLSAALVVVLCCGSVASSAETVVTEQGIAMRLLANASDPTLGITWTVPGFDDSAWTDGVYGVGYDTNGAADGLTDTVVADTTRSVYTLVQFDVIDPSAIDRVALGVDYDDAYVAWLNGVEIFRTGNLPAGDPDWNTESTSQHESSNGVEAVYTPFEDVSAVALSALVVGQNVFAIGAYNDRPGSSDLVLVPKLVLNPDQRVLVARGTGTRYLANDVDPVIGITWTDAAFDDTTWSSGPIGFGYDTNGDAAGLIDTPVPDFTRSLYTRVEFEVTDLGAIQTLALGADYDDAYVAWLNGVEIYRTSNLPAGDPDWNTESTSQHESSNSSAPVYTPLQNVTAIAVPALVLGTNVLAVGGYNDRPTSSDFVLVPTLIANPTVDSFSRGPYLQQLTPTGVVVRWRTELATESVVRFGSDPGALSDVTQDLVPATEHELAVTGLTPDTRYYYSVGDTTTTIAGGDLDHFFETAPLVASPKPTRIWVVGDSGTGDANARRVRDAYDGVTDGRYTDLWLMLGDNAYDDGTDADYQKGVFDLYPDMLRQTVLWPTIGNHDARSSESDTESGTYFDIFTLPRNGEAGGFLSGTEAYYSFDYGNIHFICLDTAETPLTLGGAMFSWLQTDLGDTLQDWVVVFFHHGPYTKGSHDSDSESRHIEIRERFVPEFESVGVDLVLSGHSHSYERSFLLNGHHFDSTTFDASMKVDPGDGRIGSDGAYLKPSGGPAPDAGAVYSIVGSSGKLSSAPLDHPAMFVSLLELGSMVVEVNELRLDATFVDDSGAVLDQFTILKSAAVPPLGAVSLFATPYSDTEIDVAWNDRSDNEDGFNIYRSSDRVGWTPLTSVGPNVVEYRDTGLSPGTYWYRVEAYNAIGPALVSNEDDATVPRCSPRPPTVGNTLLMVKDVAGLRAHWQNLPLATSYNLHDDSMKGGNFVQVVGSAPDGAVGLGLGWLAEPRLYYRIAGENGCGEGPLL